MQCNQGILAYIHSYFHEVCIYYVGLLIFTATVVSVTWCFKKNGFKGWSRDSKLSWLHECIFNPNPKPCTFARLWDLGMNCSCLSWPVSKSKTVFVTSNQWGVRSDKVLVTPGQWGVKSSCPSSPLSCNEWYSSCLCGPSRNEEGSQRVSTQQPTGNLLAKESEAVCRKVQHCIL